MGNTPNFHEYDLLSKNTKIIKSYYEDLMIGGGTMLSDKYFGTLDVTVKSPIGTEWKNYYDTLTKLYFSNGQDNQGGFFILKNVQNGEPQ